MGWSASESNCLLGALFSHTTLDDQLRFFQV